MTIPRVLIIKHGSIGDIFMSLDAVKAIQKKYSNITLLSTNSGHRIFDDSDFNFKKIIDESKFSYQEIKNFYFFPSKRWDIELKNKIILKLPNEDIKNTLDYLFEFLDNKNLYNHRIIDARINIQIILND